MAVHNAAAYLDQAFQSVLGQTFTDFEFLVIDDGSTDTSAATIARYRDARIRCIANETNIGLTRSLNRGLDLARGELVARQDADDVSHPHRLERQVRFLDQNPDVAVVGAQVRIVGARGRPVHNPLWPKSTSDRAIRWQLMFESPFVHASVMFRRSVIWCGLRGYDERFRTSQDFELWCRVAANGHGMRNLPEELMDFRVHDASVSWNYVSAGVAPMRGVWLDNLTRELGSDAVPRGWPDTWLGVLYPEHDVHPTEAAGAVLSIYARFIEKYPEARRDVEIQRHLSAMLMRVAQLSASRRDLRSLSLVMRAWRLDPAITARAVPRYLRQLLRT